mmetsp:Transcript_34838/g.62754  ORF Transcript_34838/g.62754 Transcript_34838/m.62754 type:complete len:227 (-) Transcript_34838:1212-1892(-)
MALLASRRNRALLTSKSKALCLRPLHGCILQLLRTDRRSDGNELVNLLRYINLRRPLGKKSKRETHHRSAPVEHLRERSQAKPSVVLGFHLCQLPVFEEVLEPFCNFALIDNGHVVLCRLPSWQIVSSVLIQSHLELRFGLGLLALYLTVLWLVLPLCQLLEDTAIIFADVIFKLARRTFIHGESPVCIVRHGIFGTRSFLLVYLDEAEPLGDVDGPLEAPGRTLC